MRRVAVVALIAVLSGAGTASAADPPTAAGLEAELVCPVCETTLDQSDAPIARRMKQVIRRRIAEGATAAEIKAELVDQFGTGVLAEPPKSGFDLLAWLVPLAVLVAGAVGVGLVAWGWSRRRGEEDAGPPAEIDSELERRVDAELRRYES